MTGVCAAVAAARRGAKVVLMQDRPVLGGNASSEVGVHILGADRGGKIPHARETGILEELRLKNLVRNPQASLSMWDLVVYDTVRYTPGLTLLLNCSCLDASMDGARVDSVTGWQLSTQTWHRVHAKIFADCSGDAILAPLTGAEHRMGREAEGELGESIAPPTADDLTMGMSYIYYTREYDKPMPFVPFEWARTFESCDDLPWGLSNHRFWLYSPWWCELGGEHHSIHDSELLRDELLKVTMGVWDHIKNRCEIRDQASHSALERVQFVPGRRESRRYLGDYMLTQRDIESGGRFPDVVCHGGWTIDMHHPAGIDSFVKYGEPPTCHHPAPSPFGIPYRTMFGHDVENLMFAGRIASCSHVAMSSTRVMGTCSVMGQALGTAAAFAWARGIEPADVLKDMSILQQMLVEDDVYLPGVAREMSELTREAALEGDRSDAAPLRDGVHRHVISDPFVFMNEADGQVKHQSTLEHHAWEAEAGDAATYRFDQPRHVTSATLILDSNMDRGISLRGPGMQFPFPQDMPKRLDLQVRLSKDWQTVAQINNNTQRHVTLPVGVTCRGVRLRIFELHGGERTQVYGFFLR